MQDNYLDKQSDSNKDSIEFYPLSLGQQAMWFLYQMAPESVAYNIFSTVRIRSDLDVETWQRVWQKLVERHPVLRTTYNIHNGQPVQVVHPHQQVDVKVTDASAWNEQELQENILAETDRPFDLEQGPMLRVRLFSQSDREHIQLIVMHHIAGDMWSFDILLDELRHLYSVQYESDNSPSLPSVQYLDYVNWQSEILKDSIVEQDWEYWKKQLGGELPASNLPTDRLHPAVQSYRGESHIVELDQDTISKLRELAKVEKASLYRTMLAAFQILLYRYTGQEDIMVGTPMALRWSRDDFKQIVGYFVNPVVLRANLKGNQTFKEFLHQVCLTVSQAQEHQDYPFPLLVEKLMPQRDPSRSPLYQVSFSWDKQRWCQESPKPYLKDGKVLLGDKADLKLVMEPYLLGNQRGASFDISVMVLEAGSQFKICWRYNTDLFDAATIARMAEHFQVLLAGIVANPDCNIAQLPLLTEAERHQLLVEWNNTTAAYPRDKCLHQLFEEQVEQTPDAVAVVFGDEELTYRQLNARANQLAHHLQTLGVKPEVRVGIFLERSLEMAVGLFGVLKAGGAWVPLDVSYPQERLSYMLSNAGVKIILSQDKLISKLPEYQGQLLCLDSDWKIVATQKEENPYCGVAAANLIYVAYTSGSTGKPKGIVIHHRRVVNFLTWAIDAYRVAEGSGAPVHASLSLEGNILLFSPLLVGGKIVLLSEENEIEALSACLCSQENFSLVKVTPAHLELLHQLLPSQQTIGEIGTLVIGGDVLPGASVSVWRDRGLKTRKIINQYGPTETIASCCFYEVNQETALNSVVPIGKPIANTQIYILDSHLQPVPIGVMGEIFIGGDALTSSYLNQPELTAQKFIQNPFSEDPEARLYRTGDLARYLKDGNIEFGGRIDNQVKIRAFRVETGEIEAVLKAHGNILQAYVIVREYSPGDRRLVAYVVPDKNGIVNPSQLREYLSQKLPDYMVPAAFVLLDTLPLTANGKVNRRALPAPDEQRPELEQTYVAPQSQLEGILSDIWSQLLKIDRVGIHDNFFELGGNSLLIVQAAARVERELKVKLPVVKLFQYPTLAKLANYLTASRDDLTFPQTHRQQQRSAKVSSEGIAIIGMTGRFPGAANIDELWQNLVEGVASIAFLRDDELDPSIGEELKNDPNYIKAKGILEDADRFDAAFFGINPKEAEIMDPQHRVFLEVAHQALEDAGYNPQSFDGSIGLYAGSSFNSYLTNNILENQEIVNRVGNSGLRLANGREYLTTRASYKLNLTGPSINVNTACSTSLVAVINAFNSLLNNQCDIALAGGVCITTPLNSGYLYQEGERFSPDGCCRPFDAQAQGTLLGNGVGIVVLKRLEDALKDGDRIEAVIRGVGMNNDGSDKVSFAAPSVEGQAKALMMAYEDANLNPETISYIETHGTATPLGDPIEFAALTQAFHSQTTKTGFCALGAVKSNVGHLDAAAGVTGLIKTVLALKHKQIPPTLHYQQPNPKLDLTNSPFFVNDKLAEWTAGTTPRRAGVSSFGIGGTNAHVVLEEAPKVESSSSSRCRQLLLLSAKTTSALDAATANLGNFIKTHPESNLADVAYTLQIGRQGFAHRRFIVCEDLESAIQSLEYLPPQQTATRQIKPRTPEIVFMFPGQGSQYVNMGLNLYESERVFQQTVDKCAEILQPYLERDLREILYPKAGDSEATAASLRQTFFTQPAIFTIEYALAKLWQSWGIQPQAAIGHSIGEFVAATIAGVFSLEDALMLVATRGRLMQELPGGSMLSVRLSATAVEPRLSEELSIAAINGPSLCVVSGNIKAVAQLQRELEAEGVVCKQLHTSHGFHSPMVDPIIEPFTQCIQQIQLSPPQIPFVSTVTATWITPQQATDPQYWAKHMRATVLFAPGIQTLWQDSQRVLLEVGPRNSATTLARQQIKDFQQQIAIASLGKTAENAAEWDALLSAVGQLWLAGVSIDWHSFYLRENRIRVALPTYPFERQRYWIDKTMLSENLALSQPEAKIMSQSRISSQLKEVLEDISGLEIGGLSDQITFVEMGFDSLTLTQVALALEKKFQVKITFRQLLETFPNLQTLSEHFASQLPADVAPEKGNILPSTAESNSSYSQTTSPSLPKEASNLESIFAQQLQIISRQLDLLGNGGSVSVPILPENGTISKNNKPVDTNKKKTFEGHNSKPFGAAARIQTSKAKGLNSTQQAFLDDLIERYTKRTVKSKEYAQSNRAHFADPRTVSGFSPTLKEMVYPIVVERSAGCKLWDLDGNEYIDLINGFGSSLFGYLPSFIKEAIATQLEKGIEIGGMTPLAAEAAKLFCELTNFDRATFCNSGSEAVLGAMRIARTVTNRSKIAIFSGAYHGICDEVIVRGTKNLQALPAAPGIMPEALGNILVLDYNSPQSLEILEAASGELAAILIEPVQSRRPDVQPREFLHQLRRIADKSGTVLIFDEVITGLRIHPGGAQAYFGVQADIGTYGKIAGGGMPIGVIAGKSKYMDALDGGFWQYGDRSVPEVGVTFFAGTFVRHPLAMAAAKATLEHLKQSGSQLQTQLNQKGDRIVSELNSYFQQIKAPLKLANFGSLMIPKFLEDIPLKEVLFYLMREKGVHVQENRPCFLTVAHSDADIEYIIQAFKKSVSEMKQAGIFNNSQSPVTDNTPPIPGAKLGRDTQGNPAWYVEDPDRAGKYLQVEI